MTRLRLPPFLAVLLALLLLGAQQGAFAHMIGHVGGTVTTTATVIADHGDEGHGEALSLSHVCTTCVSLAALAGVAPGPAPLAFHAAALVAPLLPPPPPACSGAVVSPYRARAPPAVL
jgi:hypothetical protein